MGFVHGQKRHLGVCELLWCMKKCQYYLAVHEYHFMMPSKLFFALLCTRALPIDVPDCLETGALPLFRSVVEQCAVFQDVAVTARRGSLAIVTLDEDKQEPMSGLLGRRLLEAMHECWCWEACARRRWQRQC